MCICCSWTSDDWRKYIENEINKFPITNDEKCILISEILFPSPPGKNNTAFCGRKFLSKIDFSITVKEKFFKKENLKELVHEIEQKVIFSSWVIPKKRHRWGTSSEKLHLHRKNLHLLYDANYRSYNESDLFCLHCWKLNLEIEKSGKVTDYFGCDRHIRIRSSAFKIDYEVYRSDLFSTKHKSAYRNDKKYTDYFEHSYLCWKFFASKCGSCGFKIAKVKGIKCLSCYYFKFVLNELMDFTETRYNTKNNFHHRVITKRQWPLRIITNKNFDD